MAGHPEPQTSDTQQLESPRKPATQALLDARAKAQKSISTLWTSSSTSQINTVIKSYQEANDGLVDALTSDMDRVVNLILDLKEELVAAMIYNAALSSLMFKKGVFNEEELQQEIQGVLNQAAEKKPTELPTD